MSKPMLVTLPFVLLLLDYWPLGRIKAQRPDIRRQLLKLIADENSTRRTFRRLRCDQHFWRNDTQSVGPNNCRC